MSKIDQNDLIYFKEACDKTYTSSRSKDSDNIIQQTVDGKDIFPKTKAEAVIMSDGKTFEELIQSGSLNPITRASDMTISGITNITSTGTYQFGITLSPSNYNVDIEKITVTSDCSEITISNISAAGFTMNVNSIPSATDHKLTIVVEDKLGVVCTKEVAFTVKVEPTALTISGNVEIDNETDNNYTIDYTPSNYNVAPTSVTITSNQASVVVSNKTNTGFTLTPNCEDSLTATITVKATMPSGNVITKTMNVSVSCGPDYDAIDDYGVAIMDIEGKFYPDAASWQAAGSPAVNGVAVSDGTHRFCIAKDIVNHVCSTSSYADAEFWGGYNKVVSGATDATNETTALQDFNGAANTDAIVVNVTKSDGYFTKAPWSAAALCKMFTFPNGSKGYLGACGEWKLVQDSISKINTLITNIGGDKIQTITYSYYWSSTQFTNGNAWYWDFYNVNCNHNLRAAYSRVRAFCSI